MRFARSLWLEGACLTVALMFPEKPATAQLSQNWTWCVNQNVSADLAISGCTAVIRSGKESPKNLARAFHNRANAYSDKGDKDRAIADYNEAIRLDPKDARAFNNRGTAYSDKGDNDRAIADYNETIRLDPKYARAFNNRGNAYGAKGDIDRAIADYNEAIRLDPKYATAFHNRGNAYGAKGDNDRAIADYNEAIRLDPKFAMAFNNRGTAYSDKGDNDRAIADYNEAIRLDPKDATAFNNRGNVYDHKGDNDRAIADYNEAIRLDPKFPTAFNNRGRLFFRNGDFLKAAADLLRANDLKPDAYAMLWRYLALGHMGQGGAAELSANATRLKTKDWPYAVIDLYFGRRSLDEMRKAASNADEKCESAFYAGEWELLRRHKAEAKASLQVAADTCPKTSVEHGGAISELKRLSQ